MHTLRSPAARLWPLLLVLAACTEPARPVNTGNVRYYANDLAGQAARCVAPADLKPAAGAAAETRMELLNDGGWCGVTVAQDGPRPFDAGLLAGRPAHGRVRVQTVGDKTRVDYIPDAGFGGSDAFAVRLLPGGATVRVAVTVAPPVASSSAPAVAPVAATPPPAVSRTPARRPARP